MGKPRLKKQSESEQWTNIARKISPSILAILPGIAEIIESFSNSFEKEFRLDAPIAETLEKEDFTHWDEMYTKSSPIADLIPLLSSMFPPNQVISSLLDKTPKENNFGAEELCAVLDLVKDIRFTKNEENKMYSSVQKNKNKIVLTMRASLIDATCLLSNRLLMFHLIKAAKNGDDLALFKAINLDKNLTSVGWIKKKIEQANFKGNREFLTKIAKASSSRISVKQTDSSLRLIFFLYMAWGLGLNKLNDPELALIINKYNIYTVRDDCALRKFRNRLGLKRYVTQRIDTL